MLFQKKCITLYNRQHVNVAIPPGGCVIAENRRIESAGVGNNGSVRTRQATNATTPVTQPPFLW